MKLKIMGFNICHCEVYRVDKIDFDVFAQTIENIGAEIIGLNEVRGEGEDIEQFKAQAKILAEKIGYNYYFAKAIDVNGKNPYGNAILSKYPIISAETIMIPDPEKRFGSRPYETRCILKAKIDVDEGLNVLVTHFGLNPDEAENAVKTVMQNMPTEKTLLMGDFNVTPENTVLKPIRSALTDTADSFKKELMSWPSDKPERKIDYIFHSSDIRTVEADIPAIMISDHRPYVATIEI